MWKYSRLATVLLLTFVRVQWGLHDCISNCSIDSSPDGKSEVDKSAFADSLDETAWSQYIIAQNKHTVVCRVELQVSAVFHGGCCPGYIECI